MPSKRGLFTVSPSLFIHVSLPSRFYSFLGLNRRAVPHRDSRQRRADRIFFHRFANRFYHVLSMVRYTLSSCPESKRLIRDILETNLAEISSQQISNRRIVESSKRWNFYFSLEISIFWIPERRVV